MDSSRFDALTRVLAAGSSRRTTLSIALGGVLGALDLTDGDAKKRKKKCKKCGPCKKCKKGKCKPKPNGTDCGGGKVCQGGICACATECSTAADCCDGAVCLPNGSCAQTCGGGVSCEPGCFCSGGVVEGPNLCTLDGLTCEDMPLECTSSALCPHGQVCNLTNCGGTGNRCAPLCGA